MVITMKCDDWEIRRILVDQGIFTYILYWDAFERFYLNPNDLKSFKGVTSWVLRGAGKSERLHKAKDHLWSVGTSQNDQGLVSGYKCPSSYNMVIGQLTLNHLGSTLSTLYLCMEYNASDGLFEVIQGDQKVSRK